MVSKWERSLIIPTFCMYMHIYNNHTAVWVKLSDSLCKRISCDVIGIGVFWKVSMEWFHHLFSVCAECSVWCSAVQTQNYQHLWNGCRWSNVQHIDQKKKLTTHSSVGNSVSLCFIGHIIFCIWNNRWHWTWIVRCRICYGAAVFPRPVCVLSAFPLCVCVWCSWLCQEVGQGAWLFEPSYLHSCCLFH